MLFFQKRTTPAVHEGKEHAIEVKERKIQEVKKTIHEDIDSDLQKIHDINKVLNNGITIQIFHAMGGNNRGH